MYEAYWGLTNRPFELEPDPRFLYPSNQHGACLAALHKAIGEGARAAGVVGEFGAGKTTVAKRLLENLGGLQYRTAYVAASGLSPLRILRKTLDQLADGDRPPRPTAAEAAAEIARLVGSLTAAGKGAVSVLDDAHAIRSKKALGDMCAILDGAQEAGGRLTLILLGDDGLEEKVSAVPDLAAHMALFTRLAPLDEEETGNLIEYRMHQAWYIGNGRVFTADAVREIHGYSDGNPRRICEIADQALARAMDHGVRLIDGVLMRAVVMEAEGKDW
jgi:general secretion pathway protein A